MNEEWQDTLQPVMFLSGPLRGDKKNRNLLTPNQKPLNQKPLTRNPLVQRRHRPSLGFLGKQRLGARPGRLKQF